MRGDGDRGNWYKRRQITGQGKDVSQSLDEEEELVFVLNVSPVLLSFKSTVVFIREKSLLGFSSRCEVFHLGDGAATVDSASVFRMQTSCELLQRSQLVGLRLFLRHSFFSQLE